MNLKLETFLAWRYLAGGGRMGFGRMISLLSTLGVVMGVAALIIVLSVMAGFERDLREKIIGARAHIIVESVRGSVEDPETLREKLAGDPAVSGAAVYVLGTVLAKSAVESTGILLWGVDPESSRGVFELDKAASPEALGKLQPGSKSVLLGEELAQRLGVDEPGEEITIFAPSLRFTALGFLPRWTKLESAGTFKTGMYEYDSSYAYTSLESARDFLGLGGGASGIALRLHDPSRAPEVADRLLQSLPKGLWARDWQRQNRNLFTALKIERRVMFILLLLIVLVAAFGIITCLVVMVMEKKKEIAVLRAQGLGRPGIVRVFVAAGGVIGAVGSLGGLGLGLAVCFLIARIPIHIPGGGSVYYIETLPVDVSPLLVLGVIPATAFLVCVLSAVYPAVRAANLEPAEVVRHD